MRARGVETVDKTEDGGRGVNVSNEWRVQDVTAYFKSPPRTFFIVCKDS